jgi:hypothetical protein
MPNRPRSRLGSAIDVSDLNDVLAALPQAEADMARRLARQGLKKWRQWRSLLRKPPKWLDLPTAEHHLVPLLLRAGAISVLERPEEGTDVWSLQAFCTHGSARQALGIQDAEAIRDDLRSAITRPSLQAWIDGGPSGSMKMATYAFLVRAADHWLMQHEHGERPRRRELAAELWHSKALDSQERRILLSRMVGHPEPDLFEARPRQLLVRGPLIHSEASLYAHAIGTVALEAADGLIGIVCIENLTTYDALLPFSDNGWLLMWTRGMPPRAEVELLVRASAVAPGVPVFAAMDPDPAGVEIALSLEERSEVTLDTTLMSVDALAEARELELEPWDRERILHLNDRAGEHRELLQAMRIRNAKGEQESFRPWLAAQLERLTAELLS